MDKGIRRIHKMCGSLLCAWIIRQQEVWTVYSRLLTQQADCFYLPVLQIHSTQAACLQSGMKTFALLSNKKINTNILCPCLSLAPVLHANTLACNV